MAAAVLSAEPKAAPLTASHAPCSSTCFEVFGIDVIIDKNFKAWLLEVREAGGVCCM